MRDSIIVWAFNQPLFSRFSEIYSRNITRRILVIFLLLSFPVSSFAEDLERHRLEFQQAIKAYEAGDYERFRQLAERNKDYMLYPYLHFMDFQTRLATLTKEEVDEFLKNYADTPLAGQLKALWIRALAKQKRWDEFIDFYSSTSSVELRCFYYSKKYEKSTDETSKNRIVHSAKRIWLSGNSLPDACDPLFQILYDKKIINDDLYKQRIELSIKNNNYSLAKFLAKNLSNKDQEIINDWISVKRKPENLLKLKELAADNEQNRIIAIEALQTLARRDAEEAKNLWPQVQKKYKFNDDDKFKMQRYIALRASYQLHPRAHTWLTKIPAKWINENVRVWTLRSALRQLDWKNAKLAVEKLNHDDLDEDELKYWRARIFDMVGEKKKSRKLLKEVAKSTNYYGFMAADYLGIDYKFQHDPLDKDSRRLTLLMGIPGLQRSHELYLMDRLTDARREWFHAIRQFDEPKIKLAAVMSYNWQWYHNAIITIARTTHLNDYQLRFPTPYKDLVQQFAEKFDVDVSWVYGIIRRESAFKLDAESGVGATGLMQLMPGTAKIQARKLGLAGVDRNFLLTPEGNIQLGSSYLDDMLRHFSGTHALATAAYNAGPRRVEKWLPDVVMPMDVWVDTIPYKETREYVKAVMAYATIFDWRLFESTKKISERMGKTVSK